MEKQVMIFDLDGVLINWGAAFEYYMKETYNRTPIDNSVDVYMYPLWVQYFASSKQIKKWIFEMNTDSNYGKTMPGYDSRVSQFIRRCVDNNFDMYFVTASGRRKDDTIVYYNRKKNIEALFDGISLDINMDTLFVEELHKSKKDRYQSIINKYSSKENIHVFDDVKSHVDTATELGVNGHWISNIPGKDFQRIESELFEQ